MRNFDTFNETADRLNAMTDEVVEAAAWADPDAHPLTTEDFARMKRTPRSVILRRTLRLTQEEFSERYRIPLRTLRQWEDGVSEPDQTAETYLFLIAKDPDYVNQILNPMAKSA